MVFICEICGVSLSNKQNLSRHIKNIHKMIQNNETRFNININKFKNKCLDGCNCSFKNLKQLREHLKDIHNLKIIKETKSFDSFADFTEWLTNINREYSQYLLINEILHKNNGSTTFYYYCNRSGVHRSTTIRKRKQKRQGSCKLQRNCTSSIVLTKNATGKCNVIFFKTHYKHKLELKHVRLQKQDRLNVAHKLSSGITVKRILEDQRRNISSTDLARKDLLTRKDITNVIRSFKIDIINGVQHENDAISVDLWVEEYKRSSFIYYKKQGEVHNILDPNDFCLIFMNASQEHFLKVYGHKIVCVDSTHGLNNYDFELTTLMVVDEFGEGLPGACMFSNRKDTVINEIFFEKVKEKIGILNPISFMTDITNVFYNAWKSVMGPAENQLFCAWHVDRAWRSNLNKIRDTEKKQNVYQALKHLQYILDQDQFNLEINSLIQLLIADEETRVFGEYFAKCYGLNFEKWAYCYRKNLKIITNMRLESMHKILKYIYLDGKKTKRLDKGIHAVVSYVRDKSVERLIKITKGKNSSQIIDIEKRHHIGQNSNFNVTVEDNNIFSLTCKQSKSYIVTKTENKPCCQLICSFCNICIHTYACTCTDFLIRSTICKHIHFIEMRTKNTNCETDQLSIFDSEECINSSNNSNKEINVHLNTGGSSNGNLSHGTTSNSEIGEIRELINNINNCLPNLEQDKILYVKKSLRVLYNFVFTENSFSQNSKRKLCNIEEKCTIGEPSNKKISKQKSFFSTKKK